MLATQKASDDDMYMLRPTRMNDAFVPSDVIIRPLVGTRLTSRNALPPSPPLELTLLTHVRPAPTPTTFQMSTGSMALAASKPSAICLPRHLCV